MENLQINHKIVIDAKFTADQWGLYTSMSESDDIADMLNLALVTNVNSGLGKEAVRKNVHIVMYYHRVTGAFDTEPCAFLEKVLNKIWP